MARRYRFDDIEVDLQGFRLLKAGKPVAVEPKALNLLIFLVENRGRLVGRRELIDVVWNGAFVTDHVLNRAIGQLRRQLADDAKEPRYVETVPTRGYRFIANVEAETGEFEDLPSRTTGVSNLLHPLGLTVQPEILPESSTLPGSTASVPSPGPQHLVELVPVSPIPPWQAPVITRLRRRPAIAAGIALALILGVVAFWLMRRQPPSSDARPIHSLAVLPLNNLTGDPGQDYLADGMTDELTAMLAKNSTLRIISHTSALQFAGTHRPLPVMARELGADGILEGSVGRTGNTVHLTIQLIQAPTDTHLWAESYDRDRNEVAALPREVAESIAKKLNSTVPPLPATRYVNPDAHDAYVHGRYLWFTGDLEEAHPYLRKATELQPDYALGWSGLADYYAAGAAGGSLDPRQAFPQQEAAAAKALQLDDSLPQAHLSMAAVYYFSRWDWAAADREVLRAIELDPRFAEAYCFRAMILTTLNRHQEAIESAKKAMEIDPFSRPYALAEFYNQAREFDAALKDAFQRFESTPNNIGLHFSVAEAYWNKGMNKEAVQFEEKAYTLESDKESALGIRRAFEQGGSRGVAHWRIGILTKSPATHYVSPTALASAYGELGERERTLALLEEAYRQHAPGLLDIQGDPHLDFLHSEERYRSIIKNMGLPPAY